MKEHPPELDELDAQVIEDLRSFISNELKAYPSRKKTNVPIKVGQIWSLRPYPTAIVAVVFNNKFSIAKVDRSIIPPKVEFFSLSPTPSFIKCVIKTARRRNHEFKYRISDRPTLLMGTQPIVDSKLQRTLLVPGTHTIGKGLFWKLKIIHNNGSGLDSVGETTYSFFNLWSLNLRHRRYILQQYHTDVETCAAHEPVIGVHGRVENPLEAARGYILEVMGLKKINDQRLSAFLRRFKNDSTNPVPGVSFEQGEIVKVRFHPDSDGALCVVISPKETFYHPLRVVVLLRMVEHKPLHERTPYMFTLPSEINRHFKVDQSISTVSVRSVMLYFLTSDVVQDEPTDPQINKTSLHPNNQWISRLNPPVRLGKDLFEKLKSRLTSIYNEK